jgi:hypothetical protein
VPQIKTNVDKNTAERFDRTATELGISRYALAQRYVAEGLERDGEPAGSPSKQPLAASPSTRGQPDEGGRTLKNEPEQSMGETPNDSGAGSSKESDESNEDSDIPLAKALRVKGLSSKSRGTVMGDGKLLLNGLIGLRSRSRSL